MIIIFTLFIIFILIIFYNIIVWLRSHELTRSWSEEEDMNDVDEIDENGMIREGMKTKDPFKEIGKFFKKIPNDIKKRAENTKKDLNKGFNFVKKNAQKGVNEIKQGAQKGFNETKKFSEKKFNEVKKGAEKSLKEIKNITKVIEKEIGKPIKMIKDVIAMITCYFNGIGDIFMAFGSYIMCGLNKIISLPSCTLYYFLDIIYYIFIGLPIWFLTLIFPPLKQVVKLVYNFMMQIDKFCFESTGFHVFKYQESVLKRCYRCEGLKGIPNLKEMCSKKKEVKVETKSSCDILAENNKKKEEDSNFDDSLFSPTDSNTDSNNTDSNTDNKKGSSSCKNDKNTKNKSYFTTETISEKDVKKRAV